jgi:UDP-N-acetylglucosamine 4-epimerase
MTPAKPAALPDVCDGLRSNPRKWLVTGSAGFIGSHLVEALLGLGQEVVSLDNFATGHRNNLEDVRTLVGEKAWKRHTFHHADIVDLDACRSACAGVDIVLHQAALGSVPRSVADPLLTHSVNATGFLNMAVAARDAGVTRFVYAASSSTYGDHPGLPKVEHEIGRPLSPYAVTKLLDELYAGVFAQCYGLPSIGLRYFNVFGARQDPEGAYAAVIPRWIDAMLRGRAVVIYGDGETTRDFCPIANVVQANLLAATTNEAAACDQVYNIALGGKLSLNELCEILRTMIQSRNPKSVVPDAIHEPVRAGDIRHSQADIGKARRLLGYEPTHDFRRGMEEALAWYEVRHRHASEAARPAARRIA